MGIWGGVCKGNGKRWREEEIDQERHNEYLSEEREKKQMLLESQRHNCIVVF